MDEELGGIKALISGIITIVVGGLILAYVLDVFDFEGASPGPESPAPNGSEPATVYISGRLGLQQVSVQGTVLIDGEHAGVLTVNKPVVSVAQNYYGVPHEFYGAGQGNIEVEDGATFEVRGGPISGNVSDEGNVED